MTSSIYQNVRPAIATNLVWPALLGAVAFAGTLASACAAPLVALAVLSAITMPQRTAWTSVALMWLTNQTLGFTVLGFPHTAQTFAWGGVIGLSVAFSLLIARQLTAGGSHSPARLLMTLALSFIGYEIGIFTFANAIGLTCPFTPSVIAQVAMNEAMWFALLYPLHLVVKQFAPNWFEAASSQGRAQ